MNSLASLLLTVGCAAQVSVSPSPGAHSPAPVVTKNASMPPLSEGFAPLMSDTKLAYFKKIMPAVDDDDVRAVIADPFTMWYDDRSMPLAYQDSVSPFVGILATRLSGRIAPREFFRKGRFRFPFGRTAGTHRTSGVASINFLRLPVVEGKRLPVVWWKEGQAYHWMFPVGTVFGEVLMQRTPDRDWVVFEVRVRERLAQGWHADALRPFPSAEDLATAVKKHRPDWQDVPELTKLIEFLGDSTTVTPRSLSDSFGVLHAEGGEDLLPKIPADLVTQLLRSSTFQSSETATWKDHESLDCHAPTAASYSIVPVNYDAGVIAVDEDSCRRCHEHAGRPIGHFVPQQKLYGQVWGSDQIFSWHPFEPSRLQSSPNGIPAKPLRRLFQVRHVIQRFSSKRHSGPQYQRLPRKP